MYVMLTSFVAFSMIAVAQTLDPTFKNAESAKVSNPILSFIPRPDNNESTLIWLETSKFTNAEKWKNNIVQKLEKYYSSGKTEKGSVNIRHCSYGEKQLKGQFCAVDMRRFESCSPNNYFNYHRAAPCIFLKLEGINDGWEPHYYNDTNDLPDDMPLQLKRHILYNITNSLERNNVWVTCGGEYPVDVEYLGQVEYYPSIQGFPGYFFPNLNSKEYLSPLLAVQFKRPAFGIVINIECRVWAKNIKYNRKDRSGSVHFELLVD